MVLTKSKGIVHIGFGVLLLALIVLYILISFASPSTGDQIVSELGQLVGVARP